VSPVRVNPRPVVRPPTRSNGSPSSNDQRRLQDVPIMLSPEREGRLTMEMYSLFEVYSDASITFIGPHGFSKRECASCCGRVWTVRCELPSPRVAAHSVLFLFLCANAPVFMWRRENRQRRDTPAFLSPVEPSPPFPRQEYTGSISC
jgi:hypothetical protein